MAQLVKNLPAMQETRVRSPDWEDPVEKGTATHSSILAWRIPWTVCIVNGVAKELDITERLAHTHVEICSGGLKKSGLKKRKNYRTALASINLNLNTKYYMHGHSSLNIRLPHFV